jgi:hypothetical protein
MNGGNCHCCRCEEACNENDGIATTQVKQFTEEECRSPAEQQVGKENSCCKEERSAENEKCFSKKDKREKR